MNSYDAQKVILKLNRDTKEDKITWEVKHASPISLGGTEKLIDNAYVATVGGRKIRLYKYQAKFYYDEGLYDWSESYRLEFIDFYDNSEWEFPRDNSILDLYDTVRYKTSKVADFFKDYLTEE
jgi:hypothetical protein